MFILLASPRWRWCPGEYLLVPYGFRFCMQPANIRLDTSAIWEKLKPTYRAHLFDEVSTPLNRLDNHLNHIGIHLKEVCESFKMNTNVTGFKKLFSFLQFFVLSSQSPWTIWLICLFRTIMFYVLEYDCVPKSDIRQVKKLSVNGIANATLFYVQQRVHK